MIERGPWYYFIPPMKDYVPEQKPKPLIARDDFLGTEQPKSLLQIMLDEDEAGKRQANG